MMKGILVRVFIPVALYLVQGMLLPSFFGGFIYPELLLCWLLSWGLLAGSQEGLAMGVFCGFLADMISPSFLGFYLAVYGFIGWFSGHVREQVYHDTILLPLSFIFTSTIAVQIIFLMKLFFIHFSFTMMGSWLIFSLEQLLWNLLFVLPVYGMAKYLWIDYGEY